MAIGIRDGRERGEQAQEHGIPRAMPDRLSTATRVFQQDPKTASRSYSLMAVIVVYVFCYYCRRDLIRL